MKKRLFAGALALLMIIGLLPVSSMLKKPMEAKADNARVFIPPTASINVSNSYTEDGNVYSESDNKGYYHIEYKKGMKTENYSLTFKDSEGNISDLTTRFTVAGKATVNDGVYTNTISFTTNKKCKVKIYWTIKNNSGNMKITRIENKKAVDVVTSSAENTTENVIENETFKAKCSEFDIEATNEAVTYYIGGTANYYIHRIEVVEDSYTYPVTIVDSKAPQTETKTGVNNAGNEITLKAADSSANFRYWENSEGIIVSRSPEVKIPVYYGDTYTAVYKDNGAVVNYLTSYGQVLYTFTETEYKKLTAEPDGPIRYGYAFNGWSKNISDNDVIAALEAGKSYDITPNYDSAQDTYKITINTEAFSGSSVTKSYRVNEVVTATVSSDNFAYWKDETGKIVSYSPTYLFFANKATTVTAFAGPAGKEDDAKAVITKVSSENEKASDGSPVVIFEYNIPAGYHIDFAGVLASKTLSGESLTVENGAYVIGDSDLSYTTYRYTLTSKAGVTWNVKPMLKYTYNGITHTIYGDEIILK